MNTQMYESPILQRNLETITQMLGCVILQPTEGELACGTSGTGRMMEPEDIVQHLEWAVVPQDFKNQKVLVTAGPTYEKIDAVRFVGNFSTGKMGFALAEELAQRGAEVYLVVGPTHLTASHPNIHRISVTSAQEMYEAATAHFPQCNAAILSAAVADFRPENQANYKIKKSSSQDDLTIHMVQNPDILASLGKLKTSNQVLVGFALETTDGISYATDKIRRKNLDFIVLNSLQDAGAGFGHDTNLVTIIDADGTTDRGTLKTKQQVATDIANHLLPLL